MLDSYTYKYPYASIGIIQLGSEANENPWQLDTLFGDLTKWSNGLRR